ncbi:MAG TPA: molybdopterin converting factor subunit 1 [Urbifossiella sp.]|nr:molybdopterin converting factor subunit 1 [Urbifossiella sp.]
MIVSVQLFSRARELASAGTLAVQLPASATVGQLRQALVERQPALAGIVAASRIAVNLDFADDQQTIRETDELAIIPPVSGG